MLQLNQFFIKEHVGLFKLSNAYDIIDPSTGVKVGLAQEKPGGFILFLRLLINKQMLPTKIEIIESPDENGVGKNIVTIKRGLTFIRSKVRVFIEGDKEIGYLKSKLFSFGGGFWIYDSSDKKFAEVKGDWKGWNFKLLDATGKEIGTVTKKGSSTFRVGLPRTVLAHRCAEDGGERQFSCNDVDHSDEILDGSESTCARLGGLDEAVDSFQDGIGQS